jgi:hypothetical protein
VGEKLERKTSIEDLEMLKVDTWKLKLLQIVLDITAPWGDITIPWGDEFAPWKSNFSRMILLEVFEVETWNRKC